MTSLQKTVDDNNLNTINIIESIENNIDAMDEEMHEPEILNAPIEIEGAFPSVLGGTFNDATMKEMYLWTYFVPDPKGSRLPQSEAGMETLEDLIRKCVLHHEEFIKITNQIADLTSKYNSLYQACTTAGIFD